MIIITIIILEFNFTLMQLNWSKVTVKAFIWLQKCKLKNILLLNSSIYIYIYIYIHIITNIKVIFKTDFGNIPPSSQLTCFPVAMNPVILTCILSNQEWVSYPHLVVSVHVCTCQHLPADPSLTAAHLPPGRMCETEHQRAAGPNTLG